MIKRKLVTFCKDGIPWIIEYDNDFRAVYSWIDNNYYLMRNGKYFSGMDFTRFAHDYTKTYHMLDQLEDAITSIIANESCGMSFESDNDDQ